MADLAVVFHWPPDAMNPMRLPELMGWHAKALKRHNPET
ncbi:GpE family phage tail protein [Sphingomonas sp. M6A6_1c]